MTSPIAGGGVSKGSFAMFPQRAAKTGYQSFLFISGGMAAAGFLLCVFVYEPLAAKIRLAGRDIQMLDQELEIARTAVGASGSWDIHGPGDTQQHLLTSEEIPLAIDEITTAGRTLGINFISIRPQDEGASQGDSFSYLPILMDVESEYQQLGQFLGRLANLETGIVVVHNFQIQRLEDILPRVRATLEIGVYLQGEGIGQE
jgi:hypothetical protein